jgi:phosphomethylpyrimidine synthase
MTARSSANSKRRTIASHCSPFYTLGPLTTDITEDVRKYAAEQAISEEEAVKKGMEKPSAARSTIQRIAREGEAQRSQKSKEFVERGAEVYAKA